MGLILILAWMFNTSELDELFRILISIKGIKLRQPQWSNTTVSNELEDDFTSGWVGVTGITGIGENNHLSSLRNAWGECRGVTGGVVIPSAKGSSGITKKTGWPSKVLSH